MTNTIHGIWDIFLPEFSEAPLDPVPPAMPADSNEGTDYGFSVTRLLDAHHEKVEKAARVLTPQEMLWKAQEARNLRYWIEA